MPTRKLNMLKDLKGHNPRYISNSTRSNESHSTECGKIASEETDDDEIIFPKLCKNFRCSLKRES